MSPTEQSRLTLDFVDTAADICALVSIAPAADGSAEALAVVLGPGEAETLVVEQAAELERESGGSRLHAAGVELEDRGEEGIGARLSADGVRLELEGRLTSPPARFDRDREAAVLAGASREVSPARITGLVETGGQSHGIDAVGHRIRTMGTIGWDRLAGLGALHASLGHGGLLCAWAARPHTAAGHGDEAVSAIMQGPDGTLATMLSALVSTQYDADGRQQRATLELEVEHTDGEDEDADPDADEGDVKVRVVRGAGTLRRGATLTLPGRRTEIGFFEWSVEGVPGLGRYDRVWRS